MTLKNKLFDIISKFNITNNCQIMIGFEFEFYILSSNNNKLSNIELDNFIKTLNQSFNCSNFKREQGDSQIELIISASFDIIANYHKLLYYKIRISQIAQKYNYKFIIAGQPFIDDCGSSLQVNLSLHDSNKNFINQKDIIENYCHQLLDLTPNIIKLLHSKLDNRFDHNINYNLFKRGKYCAPTNLSYGYNNRTCLIRIAKSQIYNSCYRIEYRAASSYYNIYNLLKALLENINIYKKNKNQYQPIYGNSFDEKYLLEKL